MTKVAILPLGIYVNTPNSKTLDAGAKLELNKLKTYWRNVLYYIPMPGRLKRYLENAFPQVTLNKVHIYWRYVLHFIPMPATMRNYFGKSLVTVLDQYRGGELDTPGFRNEIRTMFPNAKFTNKAFDAVFNQSCEATPLTRNVLKEAKALQAQGVEVYFMSNTNDLHMRKIQKECGAIPGVPFFSYHEKKLGKSLDEALFKVIKDKHPRIKKTDIALLYKPEGEKPSLLKDKMNWPFKAYYHSIATKRVAQIKATAKELCRLVISKSTGDKPNLESQLKATMGWKFAQPKAHKVVPITPAHKKKTQQAPSLRRQAQWPHQESTAGLRRSARLKCK